jgi:hypothetical protein
LATQAGAFDDRVMMEHEERRLRRSAEPKQALSIFLDAARERLGVHTLTVGTSDGSLLAGAGDDALLVATLGAKIASGEQANEQVATWRLSVGPRIFIITSLGARLTPELGEGVRRILS